MAGTPRVFCAVSATIADMPREPPPESEDAIVRTRGTLTLGPPAARPAGSTSLVMSILAPFAVSKARIRRVFSPAEGCPGWWYRRRPGRLPQHQLSHGRGNLEQLQRQICLDPVGMFRQIQPG